MPPVTNSSDLPDALSSHVPRGASTPTACPLPTAAQTATRDPKRLRLVHHMSQDHSCGCSPASLLFDSLIIRSHMGGRTARPHAAIVEEEGQLSSRRSRIRCKRKAGHASYQGFHGLDDRTWRRAGSASSARA